MYTCCAFAGLALTLFASYHRQLTWQQSAAIGITYAAVSAAAMYDYESMLIPNWIFLLLLAARMALFGMETVIGGGYPQQALLASALGCLLAGLILLIASRLSKGGVGAGDIKLFAAIGFACGTEMALSVMMLSLIVCAIAGGIVLLLKKIKSAKDKMPFAPFIWGGFVLYMALILV